MYKLLTSFQRIKDIKNSGGSLYIRCASKIGRKLCKELKALNIQVDAFLDVNLDKAQYCDNIPVYLPEIIYKNSKNFFIIIAMEDNTIR